MHRAEAGVVVDTGMHAAHQAVEHVQRDAEAGVGVDAGDGCPESAEYVLIGPTEPNAYSVLCGS